MKDKMRQIKEIVLNNARQDNIEVVSVDFVKEHKMRILRIIAKKEPALTVEDAARLNRLISKELDKYDYFEDQYYLEVSSEGLEKELKTEIDIRNALGEYICIRGYKKIEGKKEVFGDLISADDNIITIYDTVLKRNMTINKSEISKIRLAVKF